MTWNTLKFIGLHCNVNYSLSDNLDQNGGGLLLSETESKYKGSTDRLTVKPLS